MRKIMLFLIIVFVVTSCNTDTSSSGTAADWRSGSQGLLMNFVADNPPSEILSGQEVSVMVDVTNKGATDIDAGNIEFYLTGFDPNILDLRQVAEPRYPLYGKSAFNPEGSLTQYVRWTASANVPSGIDSFGQQITITACYNYETVASPEICVDPQKFAYTATSKCPFNIKDLGKGGQGGPIVVNSIEQKTTSDRIFLEIHLENKGGGTSFTTGISNCHTNLQLSDVDTVNVRSVHMPNKQFSCRPANPVRLTNGKGFVVCEAGLSGSTYFVTPLIVELQYNYRKAVTRSVNIVNIE
jgi:hypothetical protein